MFMNSLNLDDSTGVESLSLDNGYSSNSGHPNALRDTEVADDMGGDIGGDFISGSRTSVLQQQRDLQKKKLQDRMGGGVVRTSLPKQYSAPRRTDIDEKPSRFGFDDEEDEESVPVQQIPTEYSRGEGKIFETSSPTRRNNTTDRGQSRDRSRYEDSDRSNRDSRSTGGRKDSSRDHDIDDNRRDKKRGTREEIRGRGIEDDGNQSDFYHGRSIDQSRGRKSQRDTDSDQHTDPKSYKTEKVSRRDDHHRKGSSDSRNGGEKDIGNSRSSTKSGINEKSISTKSRDSSSARSCSQSESEGSEDVSSEEEHNDDTTATANDPDARLPKKSRFPVSKPKLDLTDMKSFVLRPIPRASDIVECYIERNKSGANKLFPEYCLYMKDGDRFLLTAKKRPKNRTSNYLISMQRGDLARRGTDNYVGKLRANFLGTEFAIYDGGVNPKDAERDTTIPPSTVRQELGIAMYAANVMGHRGPRKMKVCVPRVRDDGSRVVWRPRNKSEEMVCKCKEQDHTNLTYLINKPPRWNDQVCAYVLNFNGRVTMASVKNFQLVTPEDQETVVLQFGRVGKDLFTMDFRWPLCPVQAFGITLSSFDSKLACE